MKDLKHTLSQFLNNISDLFLHANFYYVSSVSVLLFALSFLYEPLFMAAIGILITVASYALIQTLILFSPSISITADRTIPEVLSLGETHKISVQLSNESTIKLRTTIVEKLPFQLGIRDSKLVFFLKAKEKHDYSYNIRPTVRGIHTFGEFYMFLNFWFPVVERRYVITKEESVDVYPSIIQMKKFELYASKRLSDGEGLKKTRRLGHGSEFEQIKQYVPGDDPRIINWKASARAGQVMTNHFQEERSQPVYQILDTSRAMKMPFNELTLLDHSINSALALSNIILKKGDKTGLLTFDKKVNTILEANNASHQLKKMLRSLYSQVETQHEANYEFLYFSARRYITKRSFLILYTNFESIYALQRVLPELRAISKRHLLLVVLFKNTELEDFSQATAKTLTDIYDQTLAKKLLREKSLIHSELERHGIMNISVTTETLTADVINKYLEVKSRGAI